jgi:hypothetical protein
VSVEDLAAEFAAQGLDWSTAERRMRTMIRNLLLAAGRGPVAAACAATSPGEGGAFVRARALYGIDVMFDTALCPKLLEARPEIGASCARRCQAYTLLTRVMMPPAQVTFCPGVERPMATDPLFFDKLFGCLFLVSFKRARNVYL